MPLSVVSGSGGALASSASNTSLATVFSSTTSADLAGPGLPLQERVYAAARCGMAVTLHALLHDLTPDEQRRLLATPTEDAHDGQSCTPLLVGARLGHDEVVDTVLDKFVDVVDLDQTGTVRIDDYVIEGASPLWCAAGAGHLKVVQSLIKAGANVNKTTKINSTPLRAACFEGRLDIVRYLCEHGADIHIRNQYNNTCLMIAAYKGHVEVVRYLLEQGADPNVAANCGATALHFSAESGNVAVVTALLSSQAAMLPNDQGMTPLVTAAERCQEDVVLCMIAEPDRFTRPERIEALELLGASFANDKDNYDIAKAFSYLKQAMEERWVDPNEPVEKKDLVRVEAYDNRRESRTVAELEAVEHDHHALHMESLAVRERILGASSLEVPHPVIFRGAVFADSARFDHCLKLWMHALKLRQRTNVGLGKPQEILAKDLLRFAQVFSQILDVGKDIEFGQLCSVLAAARDEIQANMLKVDEAKAAVAKAMAADATASAVGTNEAFKTEAEASGTLETNMDTFLYLIVIYTRISKEQISEEQHFAVMQILYDVAGRLRPRRRDGATLLHLAVNSDTPVDDFHTSDVVHFPCAATTRLLIEAGADVEAMDARRNTPLHCIVAYERIISGFVTLHSIITSLVEAGAHVDVVNLDGLTPLQTATTGVAEIILKTQEKISLKCLAARSVRKFNLTYQGQVPRQLEQFIELHGP